MKLSKNVNSKKNYLMLIPPLNSTRNGVQINQWQRKKLSLLLLASYFIAFSVLQAIQQSTKNQLFEEPYYTIGHSALKKGSSSFKKTSKLLPFARFAAFLFLKKGKKKSTSTLKSSFKKFTSLAEWHLHLHAENCVKLKSQGKGRWCLLVHFVTTDFIYEPAWGFLQFNCKSRICFLCQCIFHCKE